MSDISYYGSPVLRQIASPIFQFDEAFRKTCDRLTYLMYEYDGVGLAAPQIGISQRFAVIDVSAEGDKPMLFVNPIFTWKSDEKESDSEGCISIPGIRGMVERHASVTVKAQDINGNEFVIEKATGLLARALQHEIDHLDAVLFVDHLSSSKKQLIAGKLKKMARQTKEQ